jgi:hypothetical protein
MSDVTEETTALDATASAVRYEELRRYVLGFGEAREPSTRATGLAILKYAGLRAWIETTQTSMVPSAQPAAAQPERLEGSAQLDEIDGELARVMAAMVLARIEQERRDES